ncbi:MAG: hypothetical protein H8K09_01325 [Nitrospira sp.]|nr:hypothetical protein [Nitrospira sp.]
MQNYISQTHEFGVGCFHFGLKDGIEQGVNSSEYLSAVRELLGSFPEVEDLRCSYESSQTPKSFPNTPHCSIEEGGSPYPYLLLPSGIQFRLRLTQDRQAKIFPMLSRSRTGCGAEAYLVTINSPFYYPVAFVESLKAPAGWRPSAGVGIVRNYLRDAVNKNESSKIRFECLGPSPFHADFYIRTSSDVEAGAVEHEREAKKGYDRFVFTVNPVSVVEDASMVAELVYRNIQDELSLYYACKALQISVSREWKQIQKLVDEAIGQYTEIGLKGYLHRLARAHKPAQKAIVAIVKLKSSEIEAQMKRDRMYESVYKVKAIDYPFEAINKDLVNNNPIFPTIHAYDLLKMFGENRMKHLEILAVTLSALLGGVVGALLTKFFGN